MNAISLCVGQPPVAGVDASTPPSAVAPPVPQPIANDTHNPPQSLQFAIGSHVPFVAADVAPRAR
ncbi:MAG: hypothetical protein U0324_29885 [Polyangiales bacterium]